MVEKSDITYAFGEYSLDPGQRSFTRNSEQVHIPAKEFDTLLYFLENPGRTLTKDEMMTAIWDDTFVEEGNLAQYVSRLRKLLDANGHSYIKTLPKRGYRFDADVRSIPKLVPDTSHRFPWVWTVCGVAIILTAGILVWLFAFKPGTAAAPKSQADSQPIALTDGKQDDGAVAWTSDNHIRFFRRVSPNRFEAWIMNLDGSDKHREAPPIKDFLNGMWSPDGRKVFFMKEGDDKTTYLANSDGSDEITLPMLVGNSDWSPDSTKFVYETKVGEGNTEIYLYNIPSHQNTNLTKNPFFDADPSFTPDGQHVVFLSSPDGNADIYMMDLTGRIERRLTNHPAFDNFPSVSPDGTQLLFFSNRDGGDEHMFIRDLNDDSPPVRVTEMAGMQGTHAKCWSPDGTQLVFTSDVSGKDQAYVMNMEVFKPRSVITDKEADLQFPRVSPDGSKILYQARLSDQNIELRVTDASSMATKTIYKTNQAPPLTFFTTAEWSPDGTEITFVGKTGENSQIYVMKADGSDVHAVTNGEHPDFSPAFSNDGKEIYFSRDFYGMPKIYGMSANGSDPRPLTSKSGYEQSPVVSPDGGTILYSADRVDGRKMGLDIYAADPLAPEDERLLISRPMHESSVTFSPDGKRIAFVATSDGNWEIYVANSDGSGVFRLTRNKANDSGPTFSADGESVYFASDRDGKFAIYRVDLPPHQ